MIFVYRQLKASVKILDQLKAGIESVFGKINCDRSAISDMLGDNDAVNETNMMQYLGIIEQKTNELLQIHTYLQLKQLENKPEGIAITGPGTPPIALLGGPAAPAAQAPIVVVPPSTEDDRDDDDEEGADIGKPLTQNELKMKVLRTIQKKELLSQAAVSTTMTAGAIGKPQAPQDKTPRQEAQKKKK